MPTKSYTVLQMVRHHFNIYAGSCVALTPVFPLRFWCVCVCPKNQRFWHA